ncbi:hypothetical protein GTP44_00990 [Duganella sp. FT50W]|uniref:Tail assembly chaperone n=1 Tax=Duganella lactea TaxID=2692173 RepID=A0A6L8MJI9_9BURK|nr:phage tail assembly chaperone [Duganella lactea]MYM80535.1 hypothetical protein [Duganella lactea]
MIKITPNPTYSTPVTVELPGDNGRVEKVVFTAVFRRLTISEIEDIHKRLAGPTVDADGTADTTVATLNDDELVRDVMVGWKDVQGDDGQQLEFNDANLTALLQIFPVRPTLVRKFFETISNARAKN